MRLRPSLLRRTACVAAFAGLLATAPSAADGTLEIEWVDVLGGAATLIVTPAGETILVDAGWPGFDSRDAKRIKAALDRRKLAAIDHLIVTHYHTDHYGGVPQLAALVPVKQFYDHGPMTELPEDRRFPEMYAAYRAAAKDTTTTLKPGSTIALKQGSSGPKLTLTVVAAHGEAAGGAATPPNPACATATPQPDDTTDNRRSIAFVLRFGSFDFFNGGDLTGDVEARLACPADRVGPVDLYQVTHHGQDNSNNAALAESALRHPQERRDRARGERRARAHRQPHGAAAHRRAGRRAHLHRRGRRGGEAVHRPQHPHQGNQDLRGSVTAPSEVERPAGHRSGRAARLPAGAHIGSSALGP
jgi:beta-lactamase superfamily II metal-dependent hydrolase